MRSLKNHLLVAMPGLDDSEFSGSVIYVCDHSDDGAMGIIINQPLDLQLSDISETLELPSMPLEVSAIPLFHGGPNQKDRGFVLHSLPENESWDHTVPLNNGVGITTSLDILKAIALGEGPEQVKIALGYAGWEPGQLEEELSDNVWLHVPMTPSLIFDISAEACWHAAAMTLGIDMTQVSTEVGHA